MKLKQKIYISGAVFLGLTIFLISFVISPLFLEIKEISGKFLSQRQKLVELEKRVENLEKFKIIFPETFTGLEKIDNLFVDSKMPVDFFSFLEKTSQDSQISLEISVGPFFKNEKDPWPSLSFQLSLAGPFSNFSNFLEKLESGPYLIEIQSLNITRFTESELRSPEFSQFSLGDIKAGLSLKVYTK